MTTELGTFGLYQRIENSGLKDFLRSFSSICMDFALSFLCKPYMDGMIKSV